MMRPTPRFEVGDKVENYLGQGAMVIEVIFVTTEGLPHKVLVDWDEANPDQGPYYETAFIKKQ